MFRFLVVLCCLSMITPAQATDIWVTDLADDTDPTNGTCNLREAITAADTDTATDLCPAGSGTDTIYFAKTGTVELIQGLPTITKSLKIIGPGADFLTIDANGFDRVLFYEPTSGSIAFQLAGVTLTGGELIGSLGGGLYFDADTEEDATLTISEATITANEAGRGGGVSARSGGYLILEQVTISDNHSTGTGLSDGGGGIRVLHTELTITNSAIIDNTSFGSGGGLYLNGDATIHRTTISGNTSGKGAGGLFSNLALDIRHSTITNNTAGTGLVSGRGGGVSLNSSPTFTLKNTIIAGNFDLVGSRPDIYSSFAPSLTSYGFNLIGDRTGFNPPGLPAGNPNANGDYVGETGAPLVANLTPLQDLGGPSFSHSPDPGITPNTVVDLGDCSFGLDQTLQTYDQRGLAGDTSTPFRPQDFSSFPNASDGCDIGAVEAGAIGIPSSFDLKVLLDGPYENVLMNKALNQAGHLPLAHPYNTAPLNYSGTENLSTTPSDMVDWVYVELLEGGPEDPGGMTPVTSKVYYLEDNGDLTEPDTGFTEPRIDPGHYYVAIYHRNHLPIMSATPIYVKWNEVVGSYDFRTSLDKAYSAGGAAMRDVGGGLFTMWSGDGNADEGVSAFDFLQVWLPENGNPAGYTQADFNLSSDVSAFDFLQAWLPANGQASQVP